MGFLDKFRKKNEQQGSDVQKQDSGQPSTAGKRIKKYTSEGKPVYE